MPRYRPEPGISTLEEALTRHRVVAELSALASLLPEPAPTRKPGLVESIVRQLSGDGLRRVYEQMDELQRAAVAEMVHGPHTVFPADLFRAKYGQDPGWGRLGSSETRQKPTLLDLFFHGSRRMPDDLQDGLRAFVPPPAEPRPEAASELPEHFEYTRPEYDFDTGKISRVVDRVPLTVRETERAALHDLEAVLRLAEDGKVGVSEKKRTPTAATIRAVAAVLADGDFYDPEPPEGARRFAVPGPIRAFAWPMLLQAGGLAKPFGTRLRLTAAGNRAFKEMRWAETIRSLWQRWLTTTLLDEFSRVEAVRGQSGQGKRAMTAVAGRRAAITAGLAAMPPGKWFSVDEFFRYLRAAGHDFEVTRDPWTLYVSEPGYGYLGYDGFHGWQILQARYALCLLFEYAATLGLLDVAYVDPARARPDYTHLWGIDDLEFFSRYDGLSHLRITPLGEWCLGLADAYRPREVDTAGRLTVLPTLEVVATVAIPAADALTLKRYAEETSPRTWRLTRETLLAALEQGDAVSAIREFLASRATAALPATVEWLFAEVEERGGMLSDRGGARLIECATAELAALIAHDSRTRALCLLAGERTLAVPAEQEAEFRRALRRLGYPLAATTEAPAASAAKPRRGSGKARSEPAARTTGSGGKRRS